MLRPISCRLTVAACAAILLPFGLRADIHTWCGGNHSGGGWNVADNWKDPDGNHAVPSAGDTVVITYANGGYNKVVANDDDMPLLITLGLIDVTRTSWSEDYDCSELIFDVEQDWTVPLPVRAMPDYSSIYGAGIAGGRLRKRGSGTLTFTNAETTYGAHYGYYSNYMAYRGWFVDAGKVVFPQDAGLKLGFFEMTVAAGAEVDLPNDASTTLMGLRGAGTVVGPSNLASPSSKPGLTFGYAVGNTCRSVFSGTLNGDCNVAVYTAQAFTGVNNTMTGPYLQLYYYREKNDTAGSGEMGMTKIGSLTDTVSSVGPGKTLANDRRSFEMKGSGKLAYCGTGETTDRMIYFYPSHDLGSTAQGWYGPFVIDAGATGGIRFEGTWKFSDAYAPNLSILYLQGSNTVPCTVAGEFISKIVKSDVSYVPTIVKRGTGTWRFADHANRTMLDGVFEVADGTLQYDTIAPSNQVCALGMSTVRYSKVLGLVSDATIVPYAFLLGSASAQTNVVFEFTGSASCSSEDRPIALAGDAHIRASGTGTAKVTLRDISAYGSGAKTLTLDGTNTAENTVREVTDGDGQLAIVKDGPGLWTMTGDLDFHGAVDVRSGTLKILGQRAYTYFRATFSDFSGSGAGNDLAELALYDAGGVRRNCNLKHRWPADPVTTNGWTRIYRSNYVPPAEGEICYEPLPANGTNLQHYYLEDEAPDKLTDGDAGTKCDFQTSPVMSPSYPVAVTMHLPEGTPEIVAVDICQSGTVWDGKFLSPTNLILEASSDGLSWTTLVSTNNLTPNTTGTQWYFSDSKDTVANTPRDRTLTAGEALRFKTRAVTEACEQMSQLGTVSVAAGATLSYVGIAPVTLTSLAVDVTDGMGTLKGFTLASEMTLDVRGVDRKSRGYEIPVDLSQCEGAENVTWTYTIDGAAPTRHKVVLRDGKLCVTRPGCVIYLQ